MELSLAILKNLLLNSTSSIPENILKETIFSEIWVTMNKEKEKCLYLSDNNNDIILNVHSEEGKKMLIKIICFSSIRCREMKQNYIPLLFIIKNRNIHIRQIFLKRIKKLVKNEIIPFMLQSYVVIPEYYYLKLTRFLPHNKKKILLKI